jgi:hypothetical protein
MLDAGDSSSEQLQHIKANTISDRLQASGKNVTLGDRSNFLLLAQN